MNIALSAVLLFILLIPGFALYNGLFVGSFSKPGPKLSLVEALLGTGIFSLTIHAIALLVLHQPVRFDILTRLLGGDLKDFDKLVGNNEFKIYILHFTAYNLTINVVCFLLGRFCRLLIQANLWDVRFSLLRLHNKWWYLFNGYYLDELGRPGDRGNYDLIIVDALVKSGSEFIIYSGYLIDFVCEGELLERIYLQSPERRFLQHPDQEQPADQVFQEDIYSLKADIFCLNYSEILNFTIRFITSPETIEEVEDVSKAEDSLDN